MIFDDLLDEAETQAGALAAGRNPVEWLEHQFLLIVGNAASSSVTPIRPSADTEMVIAPVLPPYSIALRTRLLIARSRAEGLPWRTRCSMSLCREI